MKSNNDEYAFDSALDALVEFMKHLPQPTVKIIDPTRYRLILKTAAQLTDLLKETAENGELNIEINPTFNLGAISAVLDVFTINNPSAFADLICQADNFEIYPLSNGKIKLDITFWSVLKPLD